MTEATIRKPKTKLPSTEVISSKIAEYNRQPFQEALADLLVGKPSPRAITQMSEKAPQLWAQSVVMLSKLAGYTEPKEIHVNITHRMEQMPEAQLIAWLKQNTPTALMEPAIEISYTTIDADADAIDTVITEA